MTTFQTTLSGALGATLLRAACAGHPAPVPAPPPPWGAETSP